METEMELRNIDPEKLEQERFGSYKHYQMVREHMDRVREYEILCEMESLKKKMELLAKQDEVVATFIAARKRAKQKANEKKVYVFTDEQMRIAIESIERHAEQP